MIMEKIEFTPIGEVTELKGPYPDRQPFSDRRETILIYPEYAEGLMDLEPGKRIMIIFYFHLSEGYELILFAHGLQKVTGVFNSHSPRRPNGIGVTEATIVSINNGEIVIDEGDMFPGTPILDIKPC